MLLLAFAPPNVCDILDIVSEESITAIAIAPAIPNFIALFMMHVSRRVNKTASIGAEKAQ